MQTLLAGVYGSRWFLGNGGLLLAFLLVAMLFALLELVLCFRALSTGHLQVALLYGTLCSVVAKVDW